MAILDGQMERGVSFVIHGIQQDSKHAISANESNHTFLIMLNCTVQEIPSPAIYKFCKVRASLYKLNDVPNVPHHGGDMHWKQTFVVGDTR